MTEKWENNLNPFLKHLVIERDIKIICVSSVVWAKSKSTWRYNPLLERNLTLSWSWSHTTFSSLPFSFLLNRASLVAQMVKNLPAMQRDTISIPGSGGGPGEGNGNPLQYSCLENPTDRGAWQATVGLDLATTHTHTHTLCLTDPQLTITRSEDSWEAL